MIKLKQLLFENDRKGILVPRRTGDERKKRRIDAIGRQIRNNAVNGVYDRDLDFNDIDEFEDLKLKSFENFGIQNLIIDGDFICHCNDLTSLKGSPKEVTGDFFCNDNYIKTLQGAPKIVGGYFMCDNNQLTSLEGGPEYVGGNFVCSSNNLTSLKGSPKEVRGYFNCRNNNLTSLEGAPKKIGGDFYCWSNKKQFTEEEVRSVCDVGGKIIV